MKQTHLYVCALLLALVIISPQSARAATDDKETFACRYFSFILQPFGGCLPEIVEAVVPDTADSTTPPTSAQPAINTFPVTHTTSTIHTTKTVYLPQEPASSALTAEALQPFFENFTLLNQPAPLTAGVTEEQLADVLRIARGNNDRTHDRISDTSRTITESGTLSNTTFTGTITMSGLTTTALLYPNANGILTAASGLSVINNNLTIGTSTAYEKLTVDGPIYLGSEVPTTTASRLYNSAGSLYWAGNLVAGAAVGSWTASGGDVYRASGNVGIGNTSPTYKLSVVGSSTQSTVESKNTNLTGFSSVKVGYGDSESLYLDYFGSAYAGATDSAFEADYAGVTSGTSANGLNITAASGSGLLKFFTGGYAASNERMRITAAGNVGIGTTAPSDQLEITKNFRFPDTTGSDVGVLMQGTKRFAHSYGNTSLFIGNSAGNFTHTGSENVSVGRSTLTSLTSGIRNTAVGSAALTAVTSAEGNSAVGRSALTRLSTGNNNTAVGTNTLFYNVSATANSALGNGALFYVTGSYNTAVGDSAGYGVLGSSNITGNTIIGRRAGQILQTGANYNVLLGYQAGDNITTGARNIIIGYNTDAASATGSDQLNIGNTIYGDLSTGNVGIGTTAPGAKLDVENKITLTGGILRWGASADQGLLSYDTGKAIVGSAGGEELHFSTNAGTGNATRMMIDTSGLVGIGTTEPTNRLSIHSTGSLGGLNGFGGGSTVTTGIFSTDAEAINMGPSLGFGSSNKSGGLTSPYMYGVIRGAKESATVTDDYAGYLAFYTQAANSTTDERLRITSTGNVGIGTTSPAAKLHVQDGSTGYTWTPVDGTVAIFENATDSRSFVSIIGKSTAQSELWFGDESDQQIGRVRYEHDSDSLHLWTNNQSRLSITSSGNVGIGTTTPTAQLSTTGTVRFSNFGAGTLQTDASGNLSVSSDVRLKDVQGDFSRSIEALLEIEPITYNWNEASGFDRSTIYAGFSAQNIKDSIPEAVGEDPHGFLTLSDRPILATLVNAVKDMWGKIVGHDNRLVGHDDRITELEREVSQLKSLIAGQSQEEFTGDTEPATTTVNEHPGTPDFSDNSDENIASTSPATDETGTSTESSTTTDAVTTSTSTLTEIIPDNDPQFLDAQDVVAQLETTPEEEQAEAGITEDIVEPDIQVDTEPEVADEDAPTLQEAA